MYFGPCLQLGAISASWNIMISPLMILLGVTLAILKRSHWKPALPLFWVSYILIINLYFNKFLKFTTEHAPNGYSPLGISLNMSSYTYLTIFLISLVVSALLFLLSTYLLNRHLEV